MTEKQSPVQFVDMDNEGDETFTVSFSLASGSGATLSNSSATGTILDDDDGSGGGGGGGGGSGLPSVSLSDISIYEDDMAGYVTIYGGLIGSSSTDVTFSVMTVDGTATAGSDYTSFGPVTMTIPAYSTSFSFTIPITNDANAESSETFNVVLSSPSGATIGDGTATVTIFDDEPTVSFNGAVTGGEGTANGNKVSFTLALTRGGMSAPLFFPAAPVTVNYAVSFESSNPASASAADFSGSLTGSYTFTPSSDPGPRSASIDIPLTDDSLVEGTESLTLTLTSATGAHVSTTAGSTTTGTITDDDSTAPAATLNEAYGFAWEGEAIVFFVSATPPIGRAISSYEFDADDDGVFDASTIHEAAINGGLLTSTISPTVLSGAGDDGSYTGTIRVTLDDGSFADFDLPITIGNTPPVIDLTDNGYVSPGDSFELTVTITDPGPDTVSSLVIAWGDGISETFSSSGSLFTHSYSADGIYDITVTVTDEDGTYSAGSFSLIGDTDALTPSSTEPKIESPTVISLGSGLVQLSIDVNDQFDTRIVHGVNGTIIWDLNNDDSDDIYVDAPGAKTVTLSPVAGTTDTYVAKVKVVDAAGNETSVQFSFTGTAVPTPEPTVDSYRKFFIKETPDMPASWHVHHSIPQGGGIITERFLKERNPPVNIHKTEYLRAVHPDFHTQIHDDWNRWFQQKAKDANVPGTPIVQRQWAMQNVPLADITAKAAQIDTEWGSKMATRGANQSRRFKEIQKLVNSTRAKEAMGRAFRLQNIGVAIAGIGFFELFRDNAKAAWNIADHTPAQLAKWEALRGEYENALQVSVESPGTLTKAHFRRINGELKNYLLELGFKPNDVQLGHQLMDHKITLLGGLPES